MSCEPTYVYRPTFTEGPPCLAPVYERRRSRVLTPGDTFTESLYFRSKSQSYDANLISVELVTMGATGTLNVYYDGILQHQYTNVLVGLGGIATLRTRLDTTEPNLYVEMPPVGYDINDVRTLEVDGDGVTLAGIGAFSITPLIGGSGAPTDASTIASIRTGPDRTLFVISSQEDEDGSIIFPPPSDRIQQWNGSGWISYCNNVQGACPGEGTC